MFYFYDLKKAWTSGVPNGILQNTGVELFKTHKSGTTLGKMEQTGFPKTHTHLHLPHISPGLELAIFQTQKATSLTAA
jgi:hypothetical protein